MEPTPVILDLIELEILPDDLPELIPRIVSEIGPQHYKGKKPLDKSYETPIKGCELYAFKWKSKELGCNLPVEQFGDPALGIKYPG